MHSDPTHPDFWSPRYESGRTPWDLGRVPPALERFLAARPGRGQRVLLPGCGTGYEIAAFAAAGYDVTAIDFSPAAIARARDHLPPHLGAQIVQGDFFDFAFPRAPFDLIYERTFVCALPPAEWPRIAQRTADLLAPGGSLAGIYFFGDKDDGPPFGFAPGEAERIFGSASELIDDQPIPPDESPPLFANQERWQERRRKSSSGS